MNSKEERSMNSKEYRTWLRAGIRIFDFNPSILLPGESRSWMRMEDLEAAADLLGLNWRQQGVYRLASQA
jgi:hypothetical protein